MRWALFPEGLERAWRQAMPYHPEMPASTVMATEGRRISFSGSGALSRPAGRTATLAAAPSDDDPCGLGGLCAPTNPRLAISGASAFFGEEGKRLGINDCDRVAPQSEDPTSFPCGKDPADGEEGVPVICASSSREIPPPRQPRRTGRSGCEGGSTGAPHGL